jgi:penicillin-binding protein 2
MELVRKGMWAVVNESGGTGTKAKVPGVVVAGKTGTAQFWRDGKKDDHTWFVAFAPYDQPKIALAVLVQGGKSGGGVAAPIAAKIIEEILALDRGYDPKLQPLEPAVGNYKAVESVNFKDTSVPAQYAAADEETSDHVPVNAEAPRRVSRSRAEPDIRPAADNHQLPARAQPTPPPRRSFFDFFRRKPREDQNKQQPQQPNEQPKKKRFLFF